MDTQNTDINHKHQQLIHAIKEGNTHAVKSMLLQSNHALMLLSYAGNEAIRTAAENNRVDIVEHDFRKLITHTYRAKPCPVKSEPSFRISWIKLLSIS